MSEGIAGAAEREPEAEVPSVTVALAVKPEELSAEEQQAIASVAADVDAVVAAALALEVRTAEEAQQAAEFLARIKSEHRSVEKARTFIVKPLNDHVKRINNEFRPKTTALERADKIVRDKAKGYMAEQERKAAEEQALLDEQRRERELAAEEQRRRVEAEAQRERERAAREAQAAEAARRKAEQQAAEAQAKVREELAVELRTLPLSVVQYHSLHADGDRRDAAKAELERREAEARAAEARQAAAQAAEAEAEARAAEQAAHDAPVEQVPEAQVVSEHVLHAPSGSAGTTKRWTFEVESRDKVPLVFQVPPLMQGEHSLPETVELRPVDDKAIRKLVRAGVRTLPGVRIYQETGLSVRAAKG